MAGPVRLFALDVDGVLTDGSLFYSADGEDMKAFNAHDGLGLVLLKRLGVEIAVISGRDSKPLNQRLDDLSVRYRRLGSSDKVVALQDVCDDMKITMSDVAFMGDDLIDLRAMEAAGFALAPANAVAAVKAAADHVTKRSGGKGAVREACELLAEQMGASLEDAMRGVRKTLVQ